jgi:hypothetical protein
MNKVLDAGTQKANTLLVDILGGTKTMAVWTCGKNRILGVSMTI